MSFNVPIEEQETVVTLSRNEKMMIIYTTDTRS